MEATIPITPDYQEKLILNNLKADNLENTYELNILFSSNSIIFKISEENDPSNIEYSNEFSFGDLQKIGKFFKICENILNIKSSLEETFQIKKPILKVEEDSIILTIIPIISALGESTLLIPKNKKNDKENISILSNIIKRQQNEIDNLNKKVNDLEQRIKRLEEQIIDLINKNDRNNIKSDIIKSKEQVDLLNKWINNKKNELSLIYKGSRDGDSFDNFHKKCDNKGPTILIIESKDGEIFGGYTEKSWKKYAKFLVQNHFYLTLTKRKNIP